MTEKLKIENFGPIRKANIDLRKLTVFVGPQATGKSLAAQALYFLRRFETFPSLLSLGQHSLYSLIDDSPDAELARKIHIALEEWFGQNFSVYISDNTKLSWNQNHPSKKTASEVQWEQKDKMIVSSALKKRYEVLDSPKEAEVYIPAGRTLYSFLPPYSFASRIKVPIRNS
jgi:hypothetical protein